MRINNKPTSFNAFSLIDSPPISSSSSSSSTTFASRTLPNGTTEDYNQQQKITNRSRATIIYSDEENDDDDYKTKNKNHKINKKTNNNQNNNQNNENNSDGWIKPRDPSSLLPQDRQRNIEVAKSQKKNQSKTNGNSSNNIRSNLLNNVLNTMAHDDDDDGTSGDDDEQQNHHHRNHNSNSSNSSNSHLKGFTSSSSSFKLNSSGDDLLNDDDDVNDNRAGKHTTAAAIGGGKRLTQLRKNNNSITSGGNSNNNNNKNRVSSVIKIDDDDDNDDDGDDNDSNHNSDDDNDDDDDDDDGTGSKPKDGTASGTSSTRRAERESRRWESCDAVLSKAEIKSEVKRVIAKCSKISMQLKSSLDRWAGKSVNNNNTNSNSSNNDINNNNFSSTSTAPTDCINLLTISDDFIHQNNNNNDYNSNYNSSASSILTDADIAVRCPGLVLKPYQLVGVNWLKLLYVNKINGVLADDMGLGKTVQCISFLSWLQTTNTLTKKIRVHLIVVPASTLSNWENELKRFCPSLTVITYHGTQNERYHLRRRIKRKIENGEVDVILSTYTIFERESCKDDRKFIYNTNFQYLILDEGHCIKNSNSSRYMNLNLIRAKRRLLLSGTPVQNDVGELLAILSFLMPETFTRQECELMVEAFGSTSGVSINQLRGMLAPFVLRRLKHDVLDQLVAKVTVIHKVPMTEKQNAIYQDIINAYALRKEKIKLQVQQELAQDSLIEVSGASLKKRLKKNNGDSASISASSSTIDLSGCSVTDIDDNTNNNSNSNSSSNSNSNSSNNSNDNEVTDLTSPTNDDKKHMSVKSILTDIKGENRDDVNEGSDNSSDDTNYAATTGDTSSYTATTHSSVITHTTTTTATSGTREHDSCDTDGGQQKLTFDIDDDDNDLVLTTTTTAATTATTTTATTTSGVDINDVIKPIEIRELSASEAKHLFTALRKAANHPLLLRCHYTNELTLHTIAQVALSSGYFGDQCDLTRVKEEIETFSDFDIHQLCLQYPSSLKKFELSEECLYDSPKMCMLREMLPKLIADRHRMLIFSQWTRLLDLLEVLMHDMNISFLRLDGSTPVKERQELIDEFNITSYENCDENGEAPIPVFLLSTKAGGLGINLTSADTVILHDLDFNPENDRQAEDRAHRIGQLKAVTVYKLVAAETVDEDIYDMGERKRKLSTAVLSDDRSSSSSSSGSSIEGGLGVGTGTP